jgi:hypothetical protein
MKKTKKLYNIQNLKHREKNKKIAFPFRNLRYPLQETSISVEWIENGCNQIAYIDIPHLTMHL